MDDGRAPTGLLRRSPCTSRAPPRAGSPGRGDRTALDPVASAPRTAARPGLAVVERPAARRHLPRCARLRRRAARLAGMRSPTRRPAVAARHQRRRRRLADGGRVGQDVRPTTRLGDRLRRRPLEGWTAATAVPTTTDGGATWTSAGLGRDPGRYDDRRRRRRRTCGPPPTPASISTVDGAGDTCRAGDPQRGRPRRLDAERHAVIASRRGRRRRFRRRSPPSTASTAAPWQPAISRRSSSRRRPTTPATGATPSSYRSTDAAGYVEPVQSLPPSTSTPSGRSSACGRSTVGRDGVLRLQVRIDDASCPSVDWLAFDGQPA